jgi:hypothetical protein
MKNHQQMKDFYLFLMDISRFSKIRNILRFFSKILLKSQDRDQKEKFFISPTFLLF